jgi:hypothetical protein
MLALSLMLAGAGVFTPKTNPQTHVLVIAGVGGEEQYTKAFYEAGKKIVDGVRATYNAPGNRIIFLAEQPERDATAIQGLSNKEGIEKAFASITAAAKPGDIVMVVLIGHGTSQGDKISQFGIPGPDMVAEDFAKLLAPLAQQQVAFVNAASASGDFVGKLAGKNRIIVTSTLSPMERNYSRFANHFSAAFAGTTADLNKDGKVSLLEMFEYTRDKLEKEYKSAGLLQSEHAMLDDNGDGKGAPMPALDATDGRIAARFYLSGIAPEAPQITKLLAEHDALITQYEGLLVRKPTMDAAAYGQELEGVLRDLVVLSFRLRQAASM